MSNEKLLKNIENVCRTCMYSDTDLTSLYSVLSLSNKEEALNSILYKCTSIQVCNSDGFPQSICNSCLEKLAICYLYRELCFDTQTKLNQLYESQKQQVSYTDTHAELESCSDDLVPSNIDTKVTDYIAYANIKSEYSHNVDENDGINTELNLVPDEKPDEQSSEENKIIEQSCDFEYLGCDNQNSFEESDETSLYKLKEENLDLTCIICSKEYSSKYTLNRHLKVHSDIDKLKCHICMKKFTRATDVKRHLTTHTGEKPYVCDICKCSFTQSGSLAAHIRQKHKDEEVNSRTKSFDQAQEKPYLCSKCGKCFKHSSTLKMHIRRHLGSRPYKCEMCKLRFISSSRLRAHIRVHTGERPFVCHICNKNFAQSTVLSRHLKAHADIKPHKCTYCPNRFFTPYYLNIHLRKHTGEKPLSCSICSKNFACPKTLKQHEKIHSNQKPFLCMNCGKSFRRSQHLKTHIKLHVKM